jgi:hypothetical protein
MLPIFRNVWLHDRQFPDLGTAWPTNRGQIRRKGGLTVGALLRAQFHGLIHPFWGHERALVAFMSRLPAGFPSTWDARRFGGGRRRVRGRGFGGVLRALPQLRLEVADDLLELS